MLHANTKIDVTDVDLRFVGQNNPHPNAIADADADADGDADVNVTAPAFRVVKTQLLSSGCSTPRVVYICVIFLKVGEIDTIKEQYSADVLIRARWREPALDKKDDRKSSAKSYSQYQNQKQNTGRQRRSSHVTIVDQWTSSSGTDEVDWSRLWDPELYIDNTIGDVRERISRSVKHNEHSEAFVIERRHVSAVFLENLELNDFPYDVQDLSVTVCSHHLASEVQLRYDPESLCKVNKDSFVDEQEWHLFQHVSVESRHLQATDEDALAIRQALCFKARAARRPTYFFWNMLLTTFLISTLAFSTFSVDRALPQNRLQLAFTLVLTAVTFKFVVSQGLPRVSYLTYLDRYIIATLLILTFISAWHAVIAVLSFCCYKQLPLDTIEKGVLIAMAVLFVLFNVIFCLTIYFGACKRRREMHLLDKVYEEQLRRQTLMKQPEVVNNAGPESGFGSGANKVAPANYPWIAGGSARRNHDGMVNNAVNVGESEIHI